jgi:hypothetical protein
MVQHEAIGGVAAVINSNPGMICIARCKRPGS